MVSLPLYMEQHLNTFALVAGVGVGIARPPRGVTRLLIGSEWSGGWFGDNPIPTRPTTLGLAH